MDYQHYLNQIKRLNEEINALNNAYIKIGGFDAKNRDTLHLFSMMNKKKERRSKLFQEFCNYETMKILKRTQGEAGVVVPDEDYLKEIN